MMYTKKLKTFKFILLIIFLSLSISCGNNIFKAHKKIENNKDYSTADKLLKKEATSKRGKKNIKQNEVTYKYNKARIFFEKGKYSKAKQLIDGLIQDFDKLPAEKREFLKSLNIDRVILTRFQDDVLAALPRQLVKPHLSEVLNNEETENELKEYETKITNNILNSSYDSFRQNGIKIPSDLSISIERKGDFLEDIVIKLAYGDEKNKDYANVDISAFERGEYYTESTENALIVFGNILREFIAVEKDINYDDVKINISGSSDGYTVTDLKYDNEFNDIDNESYIDINSGNQKNIKLSKEQNITNETLAFLRAYHPKFEIKKINEFKSASFIINADEREQKGPEHRKVLIEIYMKNAYKLRLDKLSPQAKILVEEKAKKGNDKIVKKTLKKEKPKEYRGKKLALVIGISNYKNLEPDTKTSKDPTGLSDLKYAHEDANDFVDMLERDKFSGGGWEITKLTNEDATNGNITNAIEDLLLKSTKDDLIYIFFSGHGISHPRDINKIYLLPYDYDGNQISSSSIDYINLIKNVVDAKTENVLLFIDACKSGIGFAGLKGKIPNYTNDALLNKIKSMPKTKTIFTSTIGGQSSYEYGGRIRNGLFTYHLIEAMQGKSENTRKNPFVDLDEAFYYVRDKVEETSLKLFKTKQTPSLFQEQNYFKLSYPIAIRAY